MTWLLAWIGDIAADARPVDDGRRDDLERICDYIAESRPESAQQVAQSVVERIGTLETFPHLGRPGRVQGRERLPIDSSNPVVRWAADTLKAFQACKTG
jgi:plasmid stabilization system protein ParE